MFWKKAEACSEMSIHEKITPIFLSFDSIYVLGIFHAWRELHGMQVCVS